MAEQSSPAMLPHQVIRASAGAGKTYRLTIRMIDTLNRGASPDSILATTFTRKAAGEILGRLLLELSKAAGSAEHCKRLDASIRDTSTFSADARPPITQARCHDMLGKVCDQLHRMSVMTLDSFFHQLGRAFALELGLPPNAQVCADEDRLAVRLRIEAIERVLTDQNIDTLLDLLKRLHHDDAKRSITEALSDIVAEAYGIYREAPDQRYWMVMRVIADNSKKDRLADKDVEQIKLDLTNLLSVGGLTKPIAKALDNIFEALSSNDWFGLCKIKLLNDAANSGVFNRKPIAEEITDVLVPLYHHTIAAVCSKLADQIEARYELLKHFDEHFAALRDAHQLLLYTDMPICLSKRLAEGGADNGELSAYLDEIYFRLDGRIHHLLLDEFQDTSVQQWQIIKPIADEIASHATDAHERTFFCVGDVKQAIYGWRGGCADLLKQIPARLNLPATVNESLATSWRSSQVVLDAVNLTFDSIHTRRGMSGFGVAADKWDRDFEHHTAQHADLPGHVTLSTSCADGDVGDDDASGDVDEDGEGATARSIHLNYAVQRIHELADEVQQHRPNTSIGVLVPTNKDVNELIFRLRTRGLSASGEGGNPVSDDPAVLAVLSALLLADHPGDDAAAFHVARSPLGQFVGLDPKHTPAEVAALAADIRTRIAQYGYAPVISNWAEKVAPWCDTRSRLRLTQLVELGDEFDQARTLRPRDFVDYATSTVIEEPAPASIRVMTVHKSKGLEFDVVVLPSLAKRIGNARMPLYVVRNKPGATDLDVDDNPAEMKNDEIRAVLPAPNQSVRAAFPFFEQAHDQQRDDRLADDLCALYVAMTRARYALHLIVPPLGLTKSGKRSTKGWSDSTYATLVRESLSTLGEDESFEGDEVLYEQGDPHWYRNPAVRPPEGESAAAASLLLRFKPAKPASASRRGLRRVAPSSLEADAVIAVGDLLELRPQVGRSRGSLLHLWFEQLEYLSVAGEPVPAIDEAALRTLTAEALPDFDLDSFDQQFAQFQAMLKQPVVQAALARPTESQGSAQLWRERAFAVPLDDQLLQGIFDRVLVYRRDGKAVRAELLDYKTDSITDETLAERTEHYRPQVLAYLKALQLMLGLQPEQVSGKLLFVGIDRLVTISPEG